MLSTTSARRARHGLRRLAAGAAPVPDGGDRPPLAEPGAGGKRLIEPVHAKRLAALRHQLGLAPP
jgi:hypothetical protein